MLELEKTTEINEVERPNAEDFREIRPETEMTADEARNVWRSEIRALRETPAGEVSSSEVSDTEEYAVSYDDRLKQVPRETDHEGRQRGEWTGKQGESMFVPSDETESGKAVAESLAEYGIDGIEYAAAIPDFSNCCEAEVWIENMTANREENYAKAGQTCAEQFNAEAKDGRTDWTARDVSSYRTENQLSWHECIDTHTMQLVPMDIHRFFGHTGGVAEVKASSMAEADQVQGGAAV